MSAVSLAPALLRNPLFRGLTENQVLNLLDMGNQRVVNDRDAVLRVGQQNHSLWIVLEGEVEVKTQTGDTIATLGPGGVLGEVSLVDAQAVSATCLARGLTRVSELDPKALAALTSGDIDLRIRLLENLARILAARLRAANMHLMAGRMDTD